MRKRKKKSKLIQHDFSIFGDQQFSNAATLGSALDLEISQRAHLFVFTELSRRCGHIRRIACDRNRSGSERFWRCLLSRRRLPLSQCSVFWPPPSQRSTEYSWPFRPRAQGISIRNGINHGASADTECKVGKGVNLPVNDSIRAEAQLDFFAPFSCTGGSLSCPIRTAAFDTGLLNHTTG